MANSDLLEKGWQIRGSFEVFPGKSENHLRGVLGNAVAGVEQVFDLKT